MEQREQSFFVRAHDVVRQIPAGRVASYGQVARLMGAPRCARQVGEARASNGACWRARAWAFFPTAASTWRTSPGRFRRVAAAPRRLD